MEPLVDTVVLAAVRRGHRRTGQIARVSPLSLTAAGEEALRVRRLELR